MRSPECWAGDFEADSEGNGEPCKGLGRRRSGLATAWRAGVKLEKGAIQAALGAQQKSWGKVTSAVELAGIEDKGSERKRGVQGSAIGHLLDGGSHAVSGPGE